MVKGRQRALPSMQHVVCVAAALTLTPSPGEAVVQHSRIHRTCIPGAFATIRPPHWRHDGATSITAGQRARAGSSAAVVPTSPIVNTYASSVASRVKSTGSAGTVNTCPTFSRTAVVERFVKIRGGGASAALAVVKSLDPSVVKASFSAVGELLVCCIIGAIATRKGILDRTVLGSLSKVVYNVLLPSLLLVNVARTVYSKSLLTLLPLPVFAWIQIILCSIIARLVNAALRLDPKGLKGREMSVCCTFGNSGVLPILFASVLLRNDPDPTALPLAISYISFYLLGWSPVFWTVGYSKLAGNKPTTDLEPVGSANNRPARRSLGQRLKSMVQDPPAPLKRVMSPPIIGSVGGLLLGLSPLAKYFLGKKAPLSLMVNGIETIGKAYTPTALLVLAGSLATPTAKLKPQDDAAVSEDGKVTVPVQVMAICFVRFLLCPLLFLSLIVTAMDKGLVALDRLMLFVLFLESCMPSAQNTVIIHSLEGRQEAATVLARILLWVYVFSCLPMSALLTYFIQYFM